MLGGGRGGGRGGRGRCWEREVKLVVSGGCRGGEREERREATERESVETEHGRLEIISHFSSGRH